MRVINIRDYVPVSDRQLSDIELVDNYVQNFTGVSDDVLDLRCLNFSLGNQGSGSAGTLYKSSTPNWFFKLSHFSEYAPDDYGYESVCEVIGSRLCNSLNITNASYSILHALINIGNRKYTLYLCVSRNFKERNEKRTTLENLLKLQGFDTIELMSNFNNCKALSFYDDLCKMLLVDYILDNRDRHGANIELLTKGDSFRLAPVYDTGYSLLSPLNYDVDKFKDFNPLHNGPVNNFLISRYWEDVLCNLKGNVVVPTLNAEDLDLSDLQYCFRENGEVILKYFKSMIMRRYKYAKDFLCA